MRFFTNMQLERILARIKPTLIMKTLRLFLFTLFACGALTTTVLAQASATSQPDPLTFQVCEVPKENKSLREAIPYQEAVIARVVTDRDRKEKATKRRSEARNPPGVEEGNDNTPDELSRKIEALPAIGGLMVKTSFHPFMEAMHTAYAKHYGMTISPDMIWLLISQGFALHINQNAEQLRGKFVDFDGKKKLHVQRDGFVKGGATNDWPGVFAEFSKQIEANTGPELLDLVTGDFSTTGIAEKAAFQVTLMDAMKSFFEYSVSTMCGIPEITLEGTPEDWRKIEEKTKALAKYDLEWWVNDLAPVLKQFTAAAEGKRDQEFWQSIYKWHSVGSGNPYITGWALNFFPYTEYGGEYEELRPGKWTSPGGEELITRVATTSVFTSGLSHADFLWNYNGTKYAMEFVAGFVGFRQDAETLSLRPEINWAIVDKQRKPSPEALKAYMSPLNPPPTATTTPSGVTPSRVANPTGFPNGAAEQYHSVSAGETLYAISRKYGLTVDTLKNLNGLTWNKISIGQRIRVR
jgi:hypothetical protein